MLSRASLKLKLLLLSGLGMMALTAAVLTGVLGIRSGIEGVREIGRDRLPSVLALQALRQSQIALKASTYEAGLWERDTESQDQFATIARDKQRAWAQIGDVWQRYESIPKSAEEAQLWSKFGLEWDRWKKIDHDIIELILALAANKDAAMQAELFQKYFMLGAEQRKYYQSSEQLLDEVLALNAKHVQDETQRAEHTTTLAQTIMVSVGAAAIVALLALALAITTHILREMGGEPAAAVGVTRRIAEGDLSMPVPLRPGDQTSLLASLSQMQAQLRSLIGHVRESADELSQSSRDLARDASQVAHSDAEKGAAATATAAAVEEITGRLVHISESAQTARGLSDQAGALSSQGESVVDAAATEMERISSSVRESSDQLQKLGEQSNEISNIADVIKTIADQTNLLALNAAIEAARAGEHGRGFAVVADEVRRLAESTAASTDKITSTIRAIRAGVAESAARMLGVRDQVDSGVMGMRAASTTMGSIRSGAQDANTAVGRITESLQDGNRKLREIRIRMDNIVGMVAESTGSVQTIATSAQSMDQMATHLVAAVQRFKIQ